MHISRVEYISINTIRTIKNYKHMLESREFEKLYIYAEVTIIKKNIGNKFQEVVFGGIIII